MIKRVFCVIFMFIFVSNLFYPVSAIETFSGKPMVIPSGYDNNGAISSGVVEDKITEENTVLEKEDSIFEDKEGDLLSGEAEESKLIWLGGVLGIVIIALIFYFRFRRKRIKSSIEKMISAL